MATTPKLDKTLLEKIAIKRDCPGELNKIRKLVDAHTRSRHASSPVALVLLAKDYGFGTKQYEKSFDSDQKQELRNLLHTVTPQSITGKKTTRPNNKQRIEEVIDYDTDDHFIQGHINELNKAYTYGCYTSVNILARKIIENLIIDILKMKYPESSLANKKLYFDINQKRYHDFGVILKNLERKKHEFGSENKGVERLYKLSKQFKDDANDKTHSE
jgi:hypothetical protein